MICCDKPTPKQGLDGAWHCAICQRSIVVPTLLHVIAALEAERDRLTVKVETIETLAESYQASRIAQIATLEAEVAALRELRDEHEQALVEAIVAVRQECARFVDDRGGHGDTELAHAIGRIDLVPFLRAAKEPR